MKTAMRCDSHVPIIGPTDRYPQVVDRTYLADVATLKQLESVSATRAIRRFVIVRRVRRTSGSHCGIRSVGKLFIPPGTATVMPAGAA